MNKTQRRMARGSGVLATLAVFWAIWMNVAFTIGPSPYWFEHRFNHEIDSPILAIELSRNQGDLESVLQMNDVYNLDLKKSDRARDALRMNTIQDCFLIPLYAGSLLTFGLAYQPGRIRVYLLIMISGATAFFDYLENIFIFFTLAGKHAWPYVPSVAKWTFLAFSLFVVANIVLTDSIGPYSKATRRLLSVSLTAAGVLTLLGLSLGPYSWLALGAQLFAFILLINAAGLFGPALALRGVDQSFQADFCQRLRENEDVGPSIRDVSSIANPDAQAPASTHL